MEKINIKIKMEEEINELRRRVRTYPEEKLLIEGKRYAIDSKYLESSVVFVEGKSRRIVQEKFDLYLSLVHSLDSFIDAKKDSHGRDNGFIDKIISCMIESTRLHSENNFSNEDLFIFDCLIDRVPFKTMVIPNREEFERLYCKFKEYILNVF